MLCDKNKEALTEAAANGAAMPIPVSEHVDACAACGASLTAKKAFFAAVDARLRSTANAEVPSSFLLKVRANLGAETVSPRNLVPGWAFVCLTGALVLAIAFLSLPRRGQERNLRGVVAVPSKKSADKAGIASNSAFEHRTPHSARASKPRRQENVSMGARDEPEVLVPPDEEELLRRFYAAAERPLRHARAIVSEERELTPKLLVIDRIELAELKIESIEQPSGLSR